VRRALFVANRTACSSPDNLKLPRREMRIVKKSTVFTPAPPKRRASERLLLRTPGEEVAHRERGNRARERVALAGRKGFNIMSLELPVVFKHHVFACFQQRPPGHPRGSCGAQGAGPLWERLSNTIQGRQLSDVAMAGAGCLGFCNAGPLMVVYPEGVWYMPRTPEDIDEIVRSHFVEGKPVERLIVVLKR